MNLLKINGMNTLISEKTKDKPKDPIDILIFEKGLRIKSILPIKDIDLLVIVLNTGRLLKSKISCFKLLENATQEQLDKWELKQSGIGIRWDELDEDLSLRGFISELVLNNIFHQLETSDIEFAEVI